MLKGTLTQRAPLEGWAHVEPVIATIKRWFEEVSYHVPDGEYKVDDSGIRAIVQTLGKKSEGRYESHRDMVDLHYCWEGQELIRCAQVDQISGEGATPYDKQTDVILYDSKKEGEKVFLRSGDIVVFFPNDAHMPGLVYTEGRNRKIVLKIPVALIPTS